MRIFDEDRRLSALEESSVHDSDAAPAARLAALIARIQRVLHGLDVEPLERSLSLAILEGR